MVELLVAVAIVAILSAVTIPSLVVQFEKTRETVDSVNLRNAESLAQADYLDKWAGNSPKISGGSVKYLFVNIGDAGSGQAVMQSDLAGADPDYVKPQAQVNQGKHIEIVLEGSGVIVSAGWVA